ncbi:hypothetical protein BH09PSE5_BH09PSE5_12520 [soil metagenome]
MRFTLLCALPGAWPHTLYAQAVLPIGLAVAHGQASVSTIGDRMTVTSSDRAILNWQGFSIGAGQGVRFAQPDASSRVLNRVVGNDPSQILGQLSSNGAVWLLNPNGVLFGTGARVDVGGLVASTLNVDDIGWLSGRFSFDRDPRALDGGEIRNQGELRTLSGGKVLLLGSSVANEGLIDAPGGQIVLAAGASIELVDTHLPNLAVRVSAPAGEALNMGRLMAPGGRIDLAGAAVNQSGIVRADSFGEGPAGTITLRSSGATVVGGEMSARSSAGVGGRVEVLGDSVELRDGSSIDVSGASGGGAVMVGGGAQGKDVAIKNAQTATMAVDARIDASATADGDGGQIVLWSEKATRAYGTLIARGGPLGGNGGLIETSGYWLDARPTAVFATAPRGRAGVWLLDPNDILISDSRPDMYVTPAPGFTSTADFATVNTSTIVSALNAGNNVTITTSNAGASSQFGDVSMINATIDANPPVPVELRISAARNIDIVGSSIRSAPGQGMSLVLNAASGGSGAILVQSSNITTAGGNVSLGGGTGLTPRNGSIAGSFDAAVGYGGRGAGIDIQNSSLDAGSGAMQLHGASMTQTAPAYGVRVSASSTLTARDVDVVGWVEADGAFAKVGIESAGSIVATHSISMRGAAESAVLRLSDAPIGVRLIGGVRVVPASPDPSASLSISGTTDDVSMPTGIAYATRTGVELQGLMEVRSGASVSVTGTDASPNQNVSILAGSGNRDLSGAGPVSFFGNQAVYLSGMQLPTASSFSASSSALLQLQGSFVGTPTSFSLTGGSIELAAATSIDVGAAAVASLTTTDWLALRAGAQLSAGRVELYGHEVTLARGSAVDATMSGDAIVIADAAGSRNVSRFINDAGPAALATPNGRWLLYASDPTDSANFVSGGLAHDATYYGAIYPSPGTLSITSGNLRMFSVAPTLSLAPGNNRIALVYAPTVPAMLVSDSGQLQGVINGDRIYGQLDDPNAGLGRTLTVFPSSGPVVALDSASKPVYGYSPAAGVFTLTADVAPAPVTVLPNVQFEDKVYDGSRLALVDSNGVSLSGFSGSALPVATVSALFDTKDAGSSKAVTGTVSLSDGVGGSFGGTSRASNWTIVNPTVNGLARISPRLALVSAPTVSDKVYDGTDMAALSGSVFSGLVGSETLDVVASAHFADSLAGSGKSVAGSWRIVDGSNGGLASNYLIADPAGVVAGVFAGAANIARRLVTATGIGAADKIYDGTDVAMANGGAVIGMVGGETLGLAGTLRFDSKDAGVDKPVHANDLALVDGANGGLAGNYQLATTALDTTASIAPRAISVSGVVASSKVYDGTSAAVTSGGSLGGLIGTETLGLTSTAAFDSADAGVDKRVAGRVIIADGSGGGLARNYVLTDSAVVTSASISPATLIYLADPVSLRWGAALPAFTGTVSGFVAGETQANATKGVLDFSTTASSLSVPGVYPLTGGGLSAANYVFVQAAANATAITLVGDISTQSVLDAAAAAQSSAAQPSSATVIPAAVASSIAAESRVVDGTQSGASTTFQAVAVSSMSQESLGALLATRDQTKRVLFAQSIKRLEEDPSLADTPACQSLQQLADGKCLITESLRVEGAAAAVSAAKDARPPSVADGVAIEQSAAAPTRLVTAPRALFPKRAVRSAALPKIDRKLAVLIGSGTYADKRIPQLDNAVGDARAVNELLQSVLGYETVLIENASKESIVATLNRLAAEAAPNDSVIVFYAGHGAVVPGTGLGYWQTSDADATRPETWLSNRDIGKLMGQITSSQVALISDSCYSGSLVAEERIRAVVTALDPTQVLKGKAAVVMSSGGNEPVFDSGKQGHSVFSWNLLKALRDMATWQAGGNIFEQVRFAVARELPQRPQYGASPMSGHTAGNDYFFEKRELEDLP